MSSRDIDSTSENVLHDWARDAERDDGQVEPERRGRGSRQPSRPSTTTTWPPRPGEPRVRRPRTRTLLPRPTVETEPEEALEPTEVDEDVPELDEGEIDETPMHVELSHEHAAGDLQIPDGYAVLEGVAEGGRRAVGIVVSRFNGSVTTQLLDSALAELATAGVRQETITIMVVPGAFELPLAATALAKTRRFACIVALGCVIRGDTPHFDYVSSEAASGLQLAALETGVPVSFGLLTLDRVEQAEPRIGKGAEAVRSALEMADLFAHLRAAASR